MQDKKLIDYVETHTTGESELLYQLTRNTNLKTLSPQMSSGPYQGRFLQFLSGMIQPKRILEIGTFTGYSTICLAQGLTDDGLLHTIELNEELAPMILEYIGKADLQNKVKLHIGNARKIIPTIDETFDLVFIDADKKKYPEYFDLALDKIRTGGYIFTDNVLWRGTVYDKNAKGKNIKELDAFNKRVQADERVDNILLPIRDGIMIARKK